MSAAPRSTSSISSNSQPRSQVVIRRRHWLTGLACGGLLALILLWTATSGTDAPQVRIAATERALSAVVIDADVRLMILNANGPQDARSVIGNLVRPWENDPSTILVGADRNNPEAVYEALQRLRPKQLIVAGAPGDQATWAEIERFCREASIEITYLEHPAEIALSTITLTIYPTNINDDTQSYVNIRSGWSRSAIALGGLPDSGRFHLTVGRVDGASGIWSDIHVLSAGADNRHSAAEIILESGERIDIDIKSTRLGIRGRPAERLEFP